MSMRSRWLATAASIAMLAVALASASSEHSRQQSGGATGAASSPKPFYSIRAFQAEMSLAQLSDAAPLIAEATVETRTTGVLSERSDLKSSLSDDEQQMVDAGMTYIEWTFSVSSWLKGTGGSTITARRIANSAEPGFGHSEIPDVAVGKSYRLWLEESEAFTSATHYSLVNRIPLPLTQLLSLSGSGTQGNNQSSGVTLSSDAQFTVFQSYASNLVTGDTNSTADIFVRDNQSATVSRVSVSSAGVESNGASFDPVVSADGGVVAFWSNASNLVSGDTNGVSDVFVRDVAAGTTTRVSIDSSGAQTTGASFSPAISSDGNVVAFASSASNLVTGDTNGVSDIFVRDIGAATTQRVSLTSSGAQANGASRGPSISSVGRAIAFESDGTNLVATDLNGATDIFVRDTEAVTTTRASVSSSEAEANGASYEPSIAATGDAVAFSSLATNLVTLDANSARDVFVRRLIDETTEIASVSSSEVQGIGNSLEPSLSGSGRFVSFTSHAANLVAGDSNFVADVVVRDIDLGVTVRVSIDSIGSQANGGSFESSISGDGLFAAYRSDATNLVSGDTNATTDVLRRAAI